MPGRHVEVVLKVAERCNIDCTYCYMFNKGDESFRRKPKQLSIGAAADIAAFLRQAVDDGVASSVRIIFHGGEPLMLRKQQFAEICQAFIDALKSVCPLYFSLQTNAMLIDDGWLALFSRFKISVGVSLDGPEGVNDRYRIDHQGRGTYARTIEGVRKLQEAWRRGDGERPGLLCVIGPDVSGGELYTHFVRDLGVDFVDFLLPIETWDTACEETLSYVGPFLESALSAWLADRGAGVKIRFFNTFFAFLLRQPQANEEPPLDSIIITVASDGTFGPDDTMRLLGEDSLYDFDVRATSLAAYLDDPRLMSIDQDSRSAPAECGDCAWQNYCRGGAANGRMVNRYAPGQGFGRRSIVCDGLKSTYALMAHHLVEAGLSEDDILRRLENVA